MKQFFSILLLAVSLLLAGPVGGFTSLAQAQADTQADLDFTAWESVASRAETAVEEARASTAALEALRTELVTWRELFDTARTQNQARINTLRSQIAALDTSEDGTDLPAEVAARIAELTGTLNDLEVPRRSAEEAYSRANSLISEIDRIVRERQAQRFMELGPSPLNVADWPDAASALTNSIRSAGAELADAYQLPAQQKVLKDNLPLIVFFLVVAVVALLRGASWILSVAQRIQSSRSTADARFGGFFVSLGQLVVPVLGLVALTQAVELTGFLGFRSQIILDAVYYSGIAIIIARWLATRLFPNVPAGDTFLATPPAKAAGARLYTTLLALFWGLGRLIDQLASYEQYTDTTLAVLHLPLIVLTGVVLFRIGQILLSGSKSMLASADVTSNFRPRALQVLGRLCLMIGIGAPIGAAIGYVSAALGIIYPFVLTLGGLALLVVISGAFRDAYTIVTGKDEVAVRNALIPVLFSFVLSVVSLPLFSLIWGARVVDLREMWLSFSNGVSVGGMQISPAIFLTFAVVFTIGYMLTRVVQSALRTSVLPRTKMDAGVQTAIVSGIGYVGFFLAALIAISAAGINLSSLAIVAGALSVGIGFGLQNVVSNFVSGIILLIERPISEGDWIEVGDKSGYVREISVRSTRVETFDRSDVIIPNTDLVSGVVTNFTRGNLIGRAIISVGVAYGTDTRKVQEILTEIAQAHPMVTVTPPPSVHFVAFGADSLNFEIRAVLRDVNYILTVTSDINHEIAARFADEGIEIPFPQRDIWVRNAEALQPQPKQPAGKGKPA